MATKRKLLLALIICISIGYLIVYIEHDRNYRNKFITVNRTHDLQVDSNQLDKLSVNITTLSSSKLILIWTPFFNEDLAATITAWLANHTCAYRCEYTNNHALVSDADAIIFHAYGGIGQVPSIRHSHQRYIFFLHEAPTHVGHITDKLSAGFFNLTMTYRRDSDIVMYYDALFPVKSNDSNLDHHIIYSWKQVTDAVANKTKMALQFVSNCGTNSRRELYVEKLIAAGLAVDKFGACSRKTSNCPWGESRCEDEYIANHRFYIAFENSVCRDYVTEKFWRMKKLIVPLVLRAKDYEHIVPIGSYIAVDQFKSITQLVTYLKMLSTNTTEYLKYFEWTRTYRGPDRSRSILFGVWAGYCELCQLLHNRSAPTKSYENLQKWWVNDAECELGFAAKLASRQNESLNK